MINNDLEFIYDQLKDKYELLFTTTFALNDGYTIDVPVLRGTSLLGRFDLYKEDDAWDEFVFTAELANPAKTLLHPAGENYTHWHPQSAEEALADVIAFMEGTLKL